MLYGAMLFKISNLKKLGFHIGLMGGITVSMVFFAFFIYFPYLTRPNSLVAVPNLKGKSLKSAILLLKKYNLNYEIADSSYYADLPSGTVLSHFPEVNDTVKGDRKIYLTLNMVRPPYVFVPNVIDNSLKNARLLLTSKKLLVGKIIYTTHWAINAVLGIQIDGKSVSKEKLMSGCNVPIYTRVDVLVGDGEQKALVNIPNLVGISIELAKDIALNLGLRVEITEYAQRPGLKNGTVIKQFPESSRNQLLRIKDKINVWIVRN